MKKKLMSVIIMAAMIITLTACGAGGGTDSSSAGEDEEVTLTLMVDSDETLDGLEAVCEKAKEAVGINVELDVYTAGSDGDNLVKTRLASGIWRISVSGQIVNSNLWGRKNISLI